MKQYYIEYVSDYCNIPKSKLRYYEKKSILKHIDRDSNNKRLYTDDDIEMIKFIQCLSNLNMPLKEIRKKHRHALSKPNRCPKRVTRTPRILE